jgi:hypothetical protein
MPIRANRAIAFHEATAIEKLEDYFASSDAERHASTRAGKCDKCDLGFAIIVTDEKDPRNPEYIDQLQTMIAEDCISGLHQAEYVLDSERSDPSEPTEHCET